LIRFFRVSLKYPNGQFALDDVSFHVRPGEFALLRGSSGAGKTSLLKLLFREEVSSSGRILVNGRNVTSLPRSKVPYLRRTMGVVFQDFRLIARKTVLENVVYLPRILGVRAADQEVLGMTALESVGLAHRAGAYPAELSGGEKQRASIARAIVHRPELLIADEPTGNLDPELSREIFAVFRGIHSKGTTVLVATHDPLLRPPARHHVLTLRDGQLVGDEYPGHSAPDAVAELDAALARYDREVLR
jgi:cell division transport system ATP-binding protein